MGATLPVQSFIEESTPARHSVLSPRSSRNAAAAPIMAPLSVHMMGLGRNSPNPVGEGRPIVNR